MHDPRNCDCSQKCRRLVELASRRDLSALEQLEVRFLKYVLDKNTIYC